MKCPIDGIELVMSDRNGVEIDYCPQCRGVWLDRGELDKIIERSVAPVAAAAPPPPPSRDQRYDYEERPQRKKKRDSFLSDIFDF